MELKFSLLFNQHISQIHQSDFSSVLCLHIIHMHINAKIMQRLLMTSQQCHSYSSKSHRSLRALQYLCSHIRVTTDNSQFVVPAHHRHFTFIMHSSHFSGRSQTCQSIITTSQKNCTCVIQCSHKSIWVCGFSLDFKCPFVGSSLTSQKVRQLIYLSMSIYLPPDLLTLYLQKKYIYIRYRLYVCIQLYIYIRQNTR